MSYELTTLDNGLRVASESLPGMESVSIAINVDVGARYESPEQHGLSHLLEHMAFKGTPRRNAQEIAEIFDAIGGSVNAFTSHEHTVYYARVLKEHVPLTVDILCDILQNSLFDTTELERERHVILQELAMHDDTPDDLVFDYFQESAYGAQGLGRNILGTAEHLNHHSADAIRAFVATHYVPPRMVVSAAGAVDHAALLRELEKHLDLPNKPQPPAMEKAIFTGHEKLITKQLEQIQLILGFQSAGALDADADTAQLLSVILGGGMSSRLFQEVREKRGLVYTIQAFHAAYGDTGLFGIYAGTGEEEISELLPVIRHELARLADTLTEDELDRAKQQHRAQLLMARESNSTVAEWIGRHLMQFGEYRNAQELIERANAVTLDDLRTLADSTFRPERFCATALGPVQGLERSGPLVAQLLG